MDKIARIRQEIERRRLHFNKEAEKYQALNNGYSQNCYGARDALRDLENFLDTLSEEPDKSLEEAAEEYAYRGMPDEMKSYVKPVGDEVIKNFIAGAEWQKSQMLKDAMEAHVTTNLANRPVIYLDQLHGFEYGDKVRIVVLKEKEE